MEAILDNKFTDYMEDTPHTDVAPAVLLMDVFLTRLEQLKRIAAGVFIKSE